MITPPETPAEEKRNLPILWGGLGILLVLIFLAFAGVQITDAYRRYFRNQGDRAYAAADCELALKHYGRLPEDKLDDYEVSTSHRLCAGYLAAIASREDGEYADAFAIYLEDYELYAASPIRGFVRAEIETLFAESEPDELASTVTCSELEKSIVPDPEANLPGLYYACSQVYIGEKDYATAVEWQRDFLLDYPDDELADTVEDNLLGNPMVCDQVGTLENEPVITNRAGFMPTLYFDCAQQYDDDDEPGLAFNLYIALLTGYPNAPQADQALDALLDNPEACDQSDVLVQNKDIANRPNFIPDLLYNCADNSASEGNLSIAIGFYEWFLDDYPEDSRAANAEVILAELLLAQADAAGAGEIAAPSLSGNTTSGTSVVIIQNDSPENLRIVFSGPETRIEQLDRCVTCQIYAEIGPSDCPAEGPVGTYELTPGTYKVLVEASGGSGTSPFTGTWELGDGLEYYECFLIIIIPQ